MPPARTRRICFAHKLLDATFSIAQSLLGVPRPRRLWLAVGLRFTAGVFLLAMAWRFLAWVVVRYRLSVFLYILSAAKLPAGCDHADNRPGRFGSAATAASCVIGSSLVYGLLLAGSFDSAFNAVECTLVEVFNRTTNGTQGQRVVGASEAARLETR